MIASKNFNGAKLTKKMYLCHMDANEFVERVKYYAKVNGLAAAGDTVTVALSGGADSVALLRVLLSIGVNCSALHCNFGLRGEEADRDEAFTKHLCASLNVPLKIKHFNVYEYEREHKVSTEMACRELRYAWFEEERSSIGAKCITVAHHHDDNVETFFLNLLRGSGINGLAGIKPRNGYIVRPLLCVTREDIETYLRACNQNYVVDSTNRENDFKRNKIRNVLIPAINELFPDFSAGMSRTLQNLQGCNALYKVKVNELRKNYCSFDRDISVVDLSLMNDLEREAGVTALYEILRLFSFNSEQAYGIYAACMDEKSLGKRFLSQSHEAVIGRGRIEIFSLEKTAETETEMDVVLLKMLEKPETNSMIAVRRVVKETDENGRISGVDGKNTIALSERILSDYPVLTLRKWVRGDRIQPYGMKGSKLVSDLFADAKYSERQKREAWLLCAGDDVIWIPGLRASGKYSVKGFETTYIELTMLKNVNREG